MNCDNRLVKYIGCSDSQAFGYPHFSEYTDPRGVLVEGKIYFIYKVVIYNWHTVFYLKGLENLGFNSVCFEIIND